MIPTTATNTPTTQTSSSAMIGIASLVLEGRAMSEDEFAIPSGLVKNLAQRRSHVHHYQAAAGGEEGDDVGNSSSTIMTTSTTTSSSGARPSQVVNITMNPNAIGIPLLMARTTPAAIMLPDTTHQRWTQKICQLRQSSPTVSREMALEMIAVGVDDDKSDLDRRMTLVYHHRPVPSPIAEKLHTLQSLATTCLRASPDNTPNYGYTVLSSSPTSPLVPATTSPKYTYFTSPPRLATPFNMNSLSASPSSPTNNNCCSVSPNGYNINSPSSSSTKKQQPQQQSSKGNGIGSSSSSSSSSSCSSNGSCNTNPKQGPHCDQFLRKMGLAKGEAADAEDHICDISYGIKIVSPICIRWRTHCQDMEAIMARGEPICIEVYLGPVGHKILLEQWIIAQKEKVPGPTMTLPSLCSAIRSQLYFSQISAWCDLIKKSDRAVYDTGRILFPSTSGSSQSGKRPRLNIFYRIKPYDSTASFNSKPLVHNFPNVVISESSCISVCVKSLPRINGGIPRIGEYSVAAATVGLPPITVAGIGALFSVSPIACPSSPVSSSSSGGENNLRRASISHLPSTSAAGSINSVDSSRDESMDKGKNKCMFDDDDGGCSSDATLSHREKQLMKYKKRMLKRDKKTYKKTASDSGGESHSSQPQQLDDSQELPSSSMKYQPMQLDEKINGALDETTFADVASNGQQQTLPPEYGSINSIRPPLYQLTPPTSSIAESVQTQLVEMISTGTQTANFPQSAAFPNCDLCGSEMSMVCLNCDENFAEITPLNKADLLLQAIQRTPKTARNRKPLKNNNNSPVMTHQTTRNISDCQVCKRQKTQHHFRRKETDHQQMVVEQQQQQINNNSCSNVMNGKCANGDGPPCDCGTTSFRMDEDDENHDWNDVKSHRTAIKENNSSTYLSNGGGVGVGVREVIDGGTQFKTPNSQITTNGTSSLVVAQAAPSVKPSLLHIFNGVDKRRVLPKVNLTQIFCAATSSPIPISCPSPETTTFTFDIVNGTSTTTTVTSLQSPDANIPVQKSYSAPTLPNSPSLSPRFAKQAAFYKRRSRHLSDRSDRSSLGSDEQFSDEEVEGGIYSPASSPMKCRSRAMVYGRKPLLGNLEESLLQRRFLPKTEVVGFKVLLGASGAFCPTQLTIPASAYFYELRGEALSTPYVCEIRLPRKGYLIPSTGTVQATLLNPMGTVVRMFVIPYDFRDMPPLHQTFIRQRILAEESSSQSQGERTGEISGYKGAALSMMSRMHGGSSLGHMISSEHMKRLRYSIHLRFQTSRSGRLTLHTDIRLLISRRTDCDTAAAHAKGVLEAPNDLTTDTVMPNHPKYSARQENPNKI